MSVCFLLTTFEYSSKVRKREHVDKTVPQRRLMHDNRRDERVSEPTQSVLQAQLTT